jgi:spore coat protein U-like protein
MPVTHRRSWPLLIGLLGLPGTGLAQPGGMLCSVASTPLNFGSYEGTRPSPTDFTATVTVTCAPGASSAGGAVAFTLAFLDGAGPGRRQLTSARGALRYELYADPGRRIVIGDGAGGGSALTGGGVATATSPLRQNFTVYGRLLARQGRAPAGAYGDVVTVRLSY